MRRLGCLDWEARFPWARSFHLISATFLQPGEMTAIFVSYNKTKGKKFEILGRFGPDRARALIDSAVRKFN